MEISEVNVEKIGSIRDFKEFMLSTYFDGKEYVSFVEISGQREADEKYQGGIQKMIEVVKKKFQEDIINRNIKNSDRIKYCFWKDGDFVIYPDKSSNVKIKARVSNYGKDRLHIEIKKEYRSIFKEGEEVEILKK